MTKYLRDRTSVGGREKERRREKYGKFGLVAIELDSEVLHRNIYLMVKQKEALQIKQEDRFGVLEDTFT